jgi:lipid-A-disaccharide synthase
MKLLISALEPSANLHLEPILKEMDAKIVGIFDKRFGNPLYPTTEFSVMGFFDVLPKIKLAKRAIKEMVNLAKDVDAILLIDAPSFNLRLAKAIKERYPDKKITYYILPKVWAWKKGRVKQVEKYCDNLASIFPFEDQFYRKSTYVGNPLLDELKLRKSPYQTYHNVTFMPGSRKSEITRLMPIFREVAKEIEGDKTIIVPPFLKGEDLQKLYGDISDFNISYIAEETLAHSDFAFICSGTATLEAAIIGVPFVLAYRAKPIDYAIAKRFVKLPFVGLANIIFDFAKKAPLHTELLQEDVNKERLLQAYHDKDALRFYKASQELRELLISGSTKNLINLL